MKTLKRTFCTLVAALLLLGCLPVPAFAAGNIHDILWDASYYRTHNPDVVRVYGTSNSALRRHYETWGRKEGRAPSSMFDPKWYVNAYPDLRAAFGQNWEAAYNHYVTSGVVEGRKSSPTFHLQVYKDNYADLRAAFGTASSNNWRYLEHWRNHGQSEGRNAVSALSSASASSSTSYGSSVLYVNTNSARLTVRASASTSGRVLGYLTRGTKVTVLQSSGNWKRIQSGSLTGWASATYLSSSAPASSNSSSSSSGSSVLYVNTSSARLTVRASASTSGRVLGYLTRGTKVTVLQSSGNWKRIQSGSLTGWASATYLSSSAPASSNSSSSNSSSSNSYSSSENAILARLNAMAAGTYGGGVYKAGTVYRGPYSYEECKGFAKSVHEKLFSYNIGSTRKSPNNYQISYSSSAKQVGSIRTISRSNPSALRSLFSKARPGDFIQVRRRHGGSHSMIFLSADAGGVKVFEANVDGKNGIQTKYYTWSQFAASNEGVSVYTARSYYLH